MGLFDSFVREIRNRLTTTAAPHRSVFAVLDVETTGLNARYNRIIEIGVSLRDAQFREVGKWETLINPGVKKIDKQDIHGITDDMVNDAPSFAEIHDELSSLLDGHILLAHNAPFDSKFLNAEARRAYKAYAINYDDLFLGNMVDTIDLAKQVLGRSGSFKLSALLHRFGLTNSYAHSAGGDATATGDLLTRLFGRNTDKVSAQILASRAFHRCQDVPTLGIARPVCPRNPGQ